MRITLLNQFYKPDLAPTATLAASLAEHLSAKGNEVTVVASRGGYVAASIVANGSSVQNLSVRRLWTPRFGKARLLGRLCDYLFYYLLAAWTMIRLPRQDVILSLTTPPFIVAAALLHRLLHRRTRIVLWNMDCYPEAPESAGMLRPGGMASRLLRALNRFLFRRIDHLVCLDGAMRDMLQENYGGGQPLSATVIPNWEALALFPRDKTPNRSAPRKHDRLVVLYQGNAGVGHEFETVLECARLLRDEPVEFRFVGGGRWWRWLEEQSPRVDLARWRVEPYVPKEQTPRLLAEADVALITLRESSRGVMSPSKLHSNLAAALPVLYIGPAGSNVDEAVSRFGCGVSLRNGDALGAAAFLRNLIASAELQSDLGRHARDAFESAYCDRETLPQFSQLLDTIVHAAKPIEIDDRTATVSC